MENTVQLGAKNVESKKITPQAWKTLGVVTFAYLFDGLDSIIYACGLALIMVDFGLSKTILGLISTIFLFGQVIGGISVGAIGDILGRRKSLAFAVFTFCVGTVCTALAPIWQALAGFRALTGFGTVGAQAPMSSLLAESFPAKYRARVASVMMCMWGVAAIIGAVLVMLIAPHWGWRGTFIASGIAGLLAIPVVLKGSKESGRFTKVAEEREASDSSYWKDLSSLLSDRRYRKHVLIGMIPPFCNLTILWAFLTLLPPYVMQEMGYSLNSGMSWFIVTNIVVIFGFLAWGPVADNLGRKIAFLIFGTIAAITLPLCLLWSPNIVWFYVLSSIAYASTEAVYSGIVTYLPELFPTKIRSTAVAITNQTGRILSSFMPLLVSILATNVGTASALSWLSLVWVLMIILFIFGPETKGRSLEEITEG